MMVCRPLRQILHPLHVRDDPLIHPVHVELEGKSQSMGSLLNNPYVALDHSEQKGDLLICDLWKIGTDSIHDVRAVNTDTLSYHNKSP